ncbi:hypothetical protein DSAG12_03509 [Promethearchaeum syntrophicum]|uniref:Uncharacterized protein n=1 Tax=Promethearchaeum syntrophicum TaxID=2594042 RepID=A0A5B9DEZ2_9ARCH|nr:hypothetical protein [Candidatus Prometheoarchaeum syntrophicum]QEE17672.1 hypothetical protein DSAG12_03509 [Candidatus Prometheoarchaeum syntrophicum]
MSEKVVSIKCPTCSKEQTIKVPTSVFEEKKGGGTIKIQIHQGICCEHSFLSFFSSEGDNRGYETFDAAIDLTNYQDSKIEIFLKDILKKFGDHTINLMLHAILIDANIIVLHDKYVPDDNVSTKRLNIFLNKCLPPEYQKPLLFTSMLDRNYYKTQIDTALVINTTGIVEVQPWETIELSCEKRVISEALKILDPQLQPVILQEEFRQIFEKCKYFYEVLKEWHSIYFQDLINLFKARFPPKFSEYDYALYEQIVKSRFKGDTSRIKSPEKAKKKKQPSSTIYFF